VAAVAGKHAAASKRADRRALKERLDPIRAGKQVRDKRERWATPPFRSRYVPERGACYLSMIKSLEMLYSLSVMAHRLLGFGGAVFAPDIHPSKENEPAAVPGLFDFEQQIREILKCPNI